MRYTRSFCFSDDIYQIASPEGNVIAITAPDGSSTQIGYHETLNLPVAVNDPAGRITAYTYDERGNLISITDPAGYTTRYGYNAQWLPETITDALGKTRHLHYDTLDQLVCFTDCTGETTRFGYTIPPATTTTQQATPSVPTTPTAVTKPSNTTASTV